MRLEHIIGGEQKTAQQAAQFGLGRAGEQFAEIVQDAGVGIEFLVLILREVVRLNVVAEPIFAVGERLGAGQQFDQRRFPCPVDADQRDAVAALDHEIDVAKTLLFVAPAGRSSWRRW